MLLADVKQHFSFPEDKEEIFKDWVMKKMAISFQTFKKNLNKDYIKKGRVPDFEKHFKKQRPFWDAFVQYKLSENASKKKHFHHLGQGGYSTVIPKWQKMEDDLTARGIVPVTFDWPQRAKHFFYAHGGSLNSEDGSLITSDAIREAANRLDEALKAVSEGSFKPDREKDELTYALGTPKHTGCVRGMGVVPWKHGFSADIETYRSRSRKKAEQEDKMRDLEQRIASIEGAMAGSSQAYQQKARSAANLESSPGSQRLSSVASTEHPTGGQPTVVADESEHYPVDDITVRTPCELLN